MSDPSLALQAAIIAALKNSSAIDGLVGDHVYDRVPPSADFPYIVYGDDQLVQADFDDCNRGWEVFVPIHVWSRAVGRPEMKNIGGAIYGVLHEAELNVSGFRLLVFEHENTRYFRESDGLTNHGVVEFRGLIDAIV